MLYPKQTKTRTLIDLSGIWNFQIEEPDQPINPKELLPNAVPMAVPGSFNDQTTDAKQRDYIGNLWYERELIIPTVLYSQRIVLRFGSVTHKATVYLNGELIAKHIGGFTPFEVELTADKLEDVNILKVCVSNIIDNTTLPNGVLLEDNGKKSIVPNFDFYNYSGIHRPVKLYTTPKTYIEDITIEYDYHLDSNSADIKPLVTVNGEYDRLVVSIYNEEGDVVVESESDTLHMEDVSRWYPLNAYLYSMKVTLYDVNNQLIDSYSEEFGIRTLEIKDNQFLINEEAFYFKGFGKHEDFYVSGRGLNEPLNNLDLNLMKWMNANSMRLTHYPHAEEFIRLADRYGIVLIDETSGVGLFNKFNFDVSQNNKDYDNTWEYVNSQENHLNEVRELIGRDKNHPSVVGWAIGNEPAGHQEGAYEYFEPIAKLVKELDWEKRAVVVPNIVNASPDKDKITPLVDIITLNRYYGWYINHADLDSAKEGFKKELEEWHALYPDKPIIITEFGADTINGFRSVYATPFTEEYQVEYLEKNFEVLDELDYVIGEHVWNLADFETHPSVRRVDGNKKGVFTRERKPKSAAHYLRKRWDNFSK